VTEDGRPDRRRSSNPRYPIVAYGMLAMTGLAADAAGLRGPTRAAKSGLRLLVSNKAAAVRFARAFGAGRDEEGFRDTRDTAREARARRNAEAEVERSGSLFKILGVEPGASRAEVSAAYKQKARMYHPDRVATLAPEVREAAEIRMKEINAAYGQLKRRGG
jgi:DnaJ-domain-containing protein 1